MTLTLASLNDSDIGSEQEASETLLRAVLARYKKAQALRSDIAGREKELRDLRREEQFERETGNHLREVAARVGVQNLPEKMV